MAAETTPEPTAEDQAQSIIEKAIEAVDKRIAAARAQDPNPDTKTPATPKDHADEKLDGFHTADEWITAVKRAGTPGQSIDNRLLAKAPTGMHTMEGAEGGFLVPETINSQIMELVFSENTLLAATDTESIAGNSITLKALNETSRATGSRRGGVRGYWMTEAEQYTSSKPAWRELTLKPHKLGVFYYATDEELTDANGANLVSKLARYAAEEINFLVGDAIMNGDGVGKPLGVLNADCLISVAEETSQADNTLLYGNLIKIYSRMLPTSIMNARWYINIDIMPELLNMGYPDATAGNPPIFMAGGQFPNVATAPFGTILGRPIVPTEFNPTLGDVGDILFADLRYYKTVTRGSVRAAMSIHLRFDYGEQAFRFDFRVDGQPWLNSALTPFKGTTTQSPFVCLADRA